MEIHSLERILAQNLSWNAARIKFLARFLIALFQVQTVNLVKIASAFASPAQIASNYKRIQRFLHFFEVPQADIAAVVLRVLKIEAPYTLAIDRTEWNLGRQRVNVLVLAVNYNGISIPLFWTVWNARGCSDDQRRIALIKKFVDRFGAASIRFVTGDREFCSKELLKYFKREKIGFRLRINASYQITNARGKLVAAAQLCRSLKFGARHTFRGCRRLWEYEVYVAACRKENGDHVIVISSQASGRILADYTERWQIETLFGVLKSRGFNLEDSHLIEIERVGKLIALLTLALSWALVTGEYEHKRKPIKTKKHGRRAKSLFRLGFDTLRSCFCQLAVIVGQKQRFQRFVLLLSCT